MTLFGKLLTYLNVFAAVVLFGWATSLYVNRVNWFDEKTEDGTTPGQLTVLKGEVTKLNEQIKSAQADFARTNDMAKRQEWQRDYRVRALARIMSDVTRVDDKVRFLELDRPNNQPLIDFDKDNNPLGTVVTGLDAKPLKGLGTLRKTFDDLMRDTIAKQKSILKAREEYAAICDQVDIAQDEVRRQKLIAENLEDEQGFLSDARIIWEEQLRTLLVRKVQLEKRLSPAGEGR